MISYQDFEQSNDKKEFIQRAIMEYQTSNMYLWAKKAYRYYEGETDILNRLQWFYNSAGHKEKDNFKANNQVPSNFLKKIIMQENSYLLSNGVTTDDSIKEKLGKKFDIKLNQLGLDSLIGGMSFAYCFLNKKGEFDIKPFNLTEFLPLFDERTGSLKAGIRFWRLSDNKPMYIELYTEKGIDYYIIKDGTIQDDILKHTSYIKIIKSDILGEEVQDGDFSKLPIVVLKSDKNGRSRLTRAFKNKIDLYDIILSDFGNNLEDSQDVYWVLKNYDGQDMGEFLADYKYYKTIKVDEDGEATPNTIDVPFNARETALSILRKDIFDSTMSLDISNLHGGSLTNVVIKAFMEDLNLKVDAFEWQVIDAVEDIINILNEYKSIGVNDYTISFSRRSIVNDTEVITNLMAMRSEISDELFYQLNPYVENAEEELERMKEQQMPYREHTTVDINRGEDNGQG